MPMKTSRNVAHGMAAGPSAPPRGVPAHAADEAHVECRNVWKVFGPNAKRALAAIRQENLNKTDAQTRFDCVIGVSDVSLKIGKGEIFCIMGLSGSGKSTLLRHINRLIEPTDGQIIIEGQDISKLDTRGLQALRAKTIGMVFQHMALWPHRTIQDNVAYGLEVRGIARAKRRRIAAETLEQMQLGGWDRHYPDELSGGMQQRVGLARALAADPDILLMDEPFSALDPLIRSDLQDQFLELSARLNKTTLFVTHDLDEAIKMGDRVAIMKDGVVVQVGTPEEIVVNPNGDYVEKFVRGISRLRFISAENIMKPLGVVPSGHDQGQGRALNPTDRLPAIIDAIRAGKGVATVTGADRPIGVIDYDTLLEAIRNFSPAATPARSTE